MKTIELALEFAQLIEKYGTDPAEIGKMFTTLMILISTSVYACADDEEKADEMIKICLKEGKKLGLKTKGESNA